jgi:nucleoid-associated protein YgaU
MDLADRQAVKVLSPEILYLMERAEVMCNTEGNTLRRVSGEWRRGTRGRRPVRASQRVVAVTREIQGVLPRGSRPVRAEEARKADGALEVGSPHSTDEAW